MRRRIADVFQEAADRQSADAERERRANLPTDADRQMFLEAAQGLLALDDELRRRGERKRSILVHGDIDTPDQQGRFVAELRRAVGRVAADGFPADELAGYRVLLATLAAKGLLTEDRRVLLEATNALNHFGRAAERRRRQQWGASRPRKSIGDRRQKAAIVEQVQKEATAWRDRNPGAPKSQFYHLLIARNRRQRIHEWGDAESLRSWIGRNGIEV